jgi:hypothetical protein
MFTIIRMFDLRHVGTCPTCMRISFLAMIFCWTVTLVVLACDANAIPLTAMAIVLTLLWVAHIFRWAVLSTRTFQPQDNSRRLTLRFALALAGSAVISIAFPWEARADSGCGGWAGNSGCPPCSDYGNGACMRQNSSCGCYYCRSCGENCGNNVC